MVWHNAYRQFLFILISTLVLTFSACGGEDVTEFTVVPGSTPAVHAGQDAYFTITLKMPDDTHVYANPKGPGTGRATTVFVEHHDTIGTGDPVYPEGEKYLSPGEDKPVFIYNHGTSITIPFTTPPSTAVGKYHVTVTVDALLCSAGACMPVRKEVVQAVSVVPPDQPVTSFDELTTAGENISIQTGHTGSIPSREKAGIKIEGFNARFLHATPVDTIIKAILFGIIAGFILNFMPCVLPVVSLKVMNIISHAGRGRREVTLMGILFSAGILVSFAALAMLASFAGYNWGELFQQQWFLIAMITIIFAMALSLFGVFTFNVPSFAARTTAQVGNPYLDSFLKGLLATLLATPCSGPFLGGTLAWAMLQPPYIIFTVFMSIGVGMALPYMVLTLRPGLMRFVPRPGNWMITFEHVMAFLLAGTVIYLLGILDQAYLYPMLWFLVFIALGLWQYGRFGGPEQPGKKRLISLVVLLLVVTGGEIISFRMVGPLKGSGSKATIESSDFTLEKLYRNRENGVITMVKFTADWCPNCRLVEATSLYTKKVKSAVADYNVQLLTADLTRKDPEAEALLKELGSRSIPFLAVFPPGDDFYRPFGLRDIYSEEDVLESIRKSAVSQSLDGNIEGEKIPGLQEIQM